MVPNAAVFSKMHPNIHYNYAISYMTQEYFNSRDQTGWAIPNINHETMLLVKPDDNVNPALKVIAEADPNIEVITLKEAQDIANSWSPEEPI